MGLRDIVSSVFRLTPSDLAPPLNNNGAFVPGCVQNIVLVMNPRGGGGRSLKISEDIRRQFEQVHWRPLLMSAEASTHTETHASLGEILRKRKSGNLIIVPTHPEETSRVSSVANVLKEIRDVSDSRPAVMVAGGDGSVTMTREACYRSVDLNIAQMVSGNQSWSYLSEAMKQAPVLVPTAGGTQCNIADVGGIHKEMNWPDFFRNGLVTGMTSMVAVVETAQNSIPLDISHTSAFGLMAGLIHEAEPWKYAWGLRGSARPYHLAAVKLVIEKTMAYLSPTHFPLKDKNFSVELKINGTSRPSFSSISFLTSSLTYFGDDQYFPGMPLYGGALAAFPEETISTLMAAAESVIRGKGKRFFGTEAARSVLFGEKIRLLATEYQIPLFMGDHFSAEFNEGIRWQACGDPKPVKALKINGKVVFPYPHLVAPQSIQAKWAGKS